jgi:hypothetical protein
MKPINYHLPPITAIWSKDAADQVINGFVYRVASIAARFPRGEKHEAGDSKSL